MLYRMNVKEEQIKIFENKYCENQDALMPKPHYLIHLPKPCTFEAITSEGTRDREGRNEKFVKM